MEREEGGKESVKEAVGRRNMMQLAPELIYAYEIVVLFVNRRKGYRSE